MSLHVSNKDMPRDPGLVLSQLSKRWNKLSQSLTWNTGTSLSYNSRDLAALLVNGPPYKYIQHNSTHRPPGHFPPYQALTILLQPPLLPRSHRVGASRKRGLGGISVCSQAHPPTRQSDPSPLNLFDRRITTSVPHNEILWNPTRREIPLTFVWNGRTMANGQKLRSKDPLSTRKLSLGALSREDHVIRRQTEAGEVMRDGSWWHPPSYKS